MQLPVQYGLRAGLLALVSALVTPTLLRPQPPTSRWINVQDVTAPIARSDGSLLAGTRARGLYHRPAGNARQTPLSGRPRAAGTGRCYLSNAYRSTGGGVRWRRGDAGLPCDRTIWSLLSPDLTRPCLHAETRAGIDISAGDERAGNTEDLVLLHDLAAIDRIHRVMTGASRHTPVPRRATPLFKSPSGVALDRRGNVYVVDNGANRLVKLSPTGKVMAIWGRHGARRGEFDGPRDVAIAPDGSIYVSDSANNRVQRLSPAGQALAVWDISLNRLAVDRYGNVWGSAGGGVGTAPDVIELSPGGRQLRAWRAPKPQATGTNEGIAVDRRGFVYLTDETFDRVDQFSANGRLLHSWGKKGAKLGQLDSPEGATVDEQGNLYVAEQGNSRVQKFAPTGKAVQTYGDFFSLGLPQGVAVDPHGRVYVAAADGVHIFSPRGQEMGRWK